MRRIFFSFAIALCCLSPLLAEAQFNWPRMYDGGGVKEGIDQTANELNHGGQTDLRTLVLNILFFVLSFMGLAAVVVIVIAGMIIVVRGDDDSQREKAWKMIIYTIVGMIVIVLSSAVVAFLSFTLTDT